jgi:hypothetical protein
MTTVPNLKITCGSHECANGLHAFNSPNRTYKRKGNGRQYLDPGVCKACGASVVDWRRLHARDINDIAHTFSQLKQEMIRNEFWTRPFNSRSLHDLETRGFDSISAGVGDVLSNIIGPVASASWAFQQIPLEPDEMRTVVQYAQHAVAACCRRCTETWHGIANDHPLSRSEISYLAFLVIGFLAKRLSPRQGRLAATGPGHNAA